MKLPVCLLMIGMTVACHAQGPVSLHGRVEDATGARIPGAKVQIELAPGKASSLVADKVGEFDFAGAPGRYPVQVSSRGFADLKLPNAEFRSETASVFKMEVNPLVECGPCPGTLVVPDTQNPSIATQLANTRLSGHVQDRDGVSLAGADVSVKLGHHEIAHTSTDANGVFFFDGDAGTYDVSITLPKYVSMKSMVTFAAGKPQPVILRPVGFMAGAGWEYGALVQGGTGLEQNSNYKFLLAGGHLGKVLTSELGSGFLKGDFEYAVEAFPFWQSYTPTFQKLNCPVGATLASQCKGPTTSGGTYRGLSITPIILRWNLTSSKKWMPWIQGAGGMLYTTRKYPGIGSLKVSDPTETGPNADTSVWNFTPQFGIGTHYFLKPKRSLDFSANAIHISSASLGDKNPGVNTGVQFSAGYTWWK